MASPRQDQASRRVSTGPRLARERGLACLRALAFVLCSDLAADVSRFLRRVERDLLRCARGVTTFRGNVSLASRSVLPRQLELLRRIVEGRQVTFNEASTVYALRTRGLVTTPSPRAYAIASVTPAGRRLLEISAGSRTPASLASTNRPPLDASELLALLERHEGKITIADPPPDLRASWRRSIFAARGSSLVPSGTRIVHRGRDRGDLVIWFESVASPVDQDDSVRVVIPKQLRRPHQLIGAVRSERAEPDGWYNTFRRTGILHVRIHRSSRDRALRLVQGFVDECLRRGHEVKELSSRSCIGGLGVFIGGHGFEVVVVEETDRVLHVPTKTELALAAHDRWYRLPTRDAVPSGRLVLRTGHAAHMTTLANDRKRWRIDDHLGDAIAKLEHLGAAADKAAGEARDREAQRVLRWHAAREQAVISFHEHTRVNAIMEQVEQYRTARDIQRFIAAVRARGDIDPTTAAWLVWAAERADRIDPTGAADLSPRLLVPTPEDLGPFMRGFSPYGPERY